MYDYNLLTSLITSHPNEMQILNGIQKKSYNFCQSYNTQMYNSYINICSTHTCTINFKSEWVKSKPCKTTSKDRIVDFEKEFIFIEELIIFWKIKIP